MNLNTLLLSFSLLFAGYTFTPAPNNISTIKAEKPVFTSTLSGQLSGTISQEELSKINSNITVYKDQSPAEGYEVQSFVIVVVHVKKENPPTTYVQKGSAVDENVFATLQELTVGDQIILDQVKVNTPKEGVRNCAPQIYTITK